MTSATDLVARKADTGRIVCRLCDGPVLFRFVGQVLKKYPVGYWRCERCLSLQTDRPHWLDEAYESVFPIRDTGMVARNLQMAQTSSLILRVAGVAADTVCLDWGGGNGLFCRMMRDQGYNFLSYDKYAQPFYCIGFTANSTTLPQCDVVTSFEVFEHLPEPKANLAEILRYNPRLWIFSTQLYRDQGLDWEYLARDAGRHVFFYSERALHEFAENHGFLFIPGRHLHVFVRRTNNPYLRGSRRIGLAKMILRGGRAVSFASALYFVARQRHAYLRWQADRNGLTAGGAH